MSHFGKNYKTDGGDTTVIGGSLIIEEGASVQGLSSSDVDFPVMDNQTDSEATTIAALKEDFNGLLSKLKSAGLMEADA